MVYVLGGWGGEEGEGKHIGGLLVVGGGGGFMHLQIFARCFPISGQLDCVPMHIPNLPSPVSV